MKRNGRIVGGILLLAFGIGWILSLAGLINVSLDGWWTFLIIIPCFVSLFTSKHKGLAFIGFGIGVLLLLSTLGIVSWDDLWKYIIALVAVVWGFALICGHKGTTSNKQTARHSVDELKLMTQDGRQIHRIDVSFGKQVYEFAGQHFEGAEVDSHFGFVAIDLRRADILDGAVIKLDCSFGGIEIRVDENVYVNASVSASFAGAENQCGVQPATGVKTIYVKGTCSFGGIEIK